MIVVFKHKGLHKLYEGRTSKGVSPNHVKKLNRILSALDQAEGPHDMDLPGFSIHPLKGKQRDHYAVWVSGNWRVTFRFEEVNATDMDYIDYH